MAIDLAGLAVGLDGFERQVLDRSNPMWETTTDGNDTKQGSFIDWRTDHADAIRRISRALRDDHLKDGTIRAMCSRSSGMLNDFLDDNSLPASFRESDIDGASTIGIASVTDILPEWYGEAQPFVVRAQDGEPFRGFVVEKGVEFYATELRHGGLKDPLIRIRTRSGGSLWLMATKRPSSEVDLAVRATAILQASHRRENRYGTSLAMPELVVSLKPDTSWLHGLQTINGGTSDAIKATYQQINLCLTPNQQTNGTPTRTSADDTFIMNESFMGFFTLPDPANSPYHQVPVGVFFSDSGSWQPPAEPIPV